MFFLQPLQRRGRPALVGRHRDKHVLAVGLAEATDEAPRALAALARALGKVLAGVQVRQAVLAPDRAKDARVAPVEDTLCDVVGGVKAREKVVELRLSAFEPW